MTSLNLFWFTRQKRLTFYILELHFSGFHCSVVAASLLNVNGGRQIKCGAFLFSIARNRVSVIRYEKSIYVIFHNQRVKNFIVLFF